MPVTGRSGPPLYPGAVTEPDLFPPTETEAEPARRRRLRDRKGLMITLGVLLVLVLGVVGVVAFSALRLDRNIERVPDVFEGVTDRPEAPTPEPGETATPLNVLVLGTDSRISAGDPSQWTQGAQRTDVMMLVHLAADRESGYVMSIPRDAWVPIPGHGEAKINAAFSYGGPSLLIQTVEDLTGVLIDHFAVTDFESFERITDSMGGVWMTLKEPLVDRGREILPAGNHLMTGEQALTYVRQRKNLARGDFDRVQRQQAWMRAMVSRVLDEEILRDPTRWYPLLDAVTASVAVDEGLTRNRMTSLLMEARDLRPGNMAFFTVPIQGTGRSADGQSIVVLDRPNFDALMAAVRDDTVGDFLAANADAVDRLGSEAP